MAIFGERHFGYRCGVVVFFFGLAVYGVGFSCPFWADARLAGNDVPPDSGGHNGLWQVCVYGKDFNVCFSPVGNEDDPNSGVWANFRSAQAFQCIALVGFLIAGGVVIYINCCRQSTNVTRYPEGIIAVSSLCALFAIIVYATERETLVVFPYVDDQLLKATINIRPLRWAFIVDAVGCSMTLISAILIAVFNKPFRSDPLMESVTFTRGSYLTFRSDL